MTGIEKVGGRILEIKAEHAEFDARKKRESEPIYDWMCRYFGWTQITPPKINFCAPGGLAPQEIEVPIEKETGI